MVVGDQGTSKAKYDLNDKRLMILEFTDAGNVMVTSIEAQRPVQSLLAFTRAILGWAQKR
jgi:hypothetical protein